MFLFLLSGAAVLGTAPSTAELGVGINLGNTLEAPAEGGGTGGWWNASLFDAYRAAGFGTVRVPVRWDAHLGTTPPYALDAAWLGRVDEVVSYGVRIGLNVIVNAHDDCWIDRADDAEFAAALPRFTALWRQVAAHFGDAHADALMFEVYNEPHNMTTASLNALNAAVLPLIRAASPTRGVLISGNGWMAVWWLRGGGEQQLDFAPGGAPDPNLMLEIHDYSPTNVTTPSGAGFPVADWGSATDVARLSQDMAWMGGFAARHPHLTLVLGEFACARLQPNATSRALWYATVARGARAAGVAPILWDDNGWFRTLDRQTLLWDDAVLRAVQLLPGERQVPEVGATEGLGDMELALPLPPGEAEEEPRGAKRRAAGSIDVREDVSL